MLGAGPCHRARALAEELPVENLVRKRVYALLAGDWAIPLPASNPVLDELSARLSTDTKGAL